MWHHDALETGYLVSITNFISANFTLTMQASDVFARVTHCDVIGSLVTWVVRRLVNTPKVQLTVEEWRLHH